MSQSKKVKISVCIPVYNSGKYLKKCLDSVINQTFKEIEIIIINDASSDNSDKIIKEYQKKDWRIIYLKNKVNQGSSFSRLKMINQSHGEYLCFIDSDDWVDIKMLEKMYRCAKEEEADITVCDYYSIITQKQNEFRRTDYTSWKKKYNNKRLKDRDLIMYNVKGGFYHIGSNLCMKLWKSYLFKNKKEFFKKNNFGEDFYTTTRVFFSNPNIKISVVPEPLYYYYVYEKNYDYIKDRTFYYLEIYNFFKEKNYFKEIEYFSKRIFRDLNYQLARLLLRSNHNHDLKEYYQSLKQLQQAYDFKIKGKILLKSAEIAQIETALFLTRYPLFLILVILDFRNLMNEIFRKIYTDSKAFLRSFKSDKKTIRSN